MARTIRNIICAFVLAASFLILNGSTNAQSVYSAFDDFSGTLNPTPGGVWRYGYTTILGGPIHLYTSTSLHGHYDPLLTTWTDGVRMDPNVIKNETGQDITLPLGGGFLIPATEYLYFHPGPVGEYSVVRWTAPSAGLYEMATTFRAPINSCPTTADVHVLHNGVSVYDALVEQSAGVSDQDLRNFTVVLTVAMGDTVDFATGFGSNHEYTCDRVLLRATISAAVDNVAPTVDASSDATIDEGSVFAQSGSFADPDPDTWTATVNYGDGSGIQPLALTGRTFTLNHTYVDDGINAVEVCVTDDVGGIGCDTVTVTVSNVAPTVNVGGDVAIDESNTFAQSGSFTDPGADTWTATVNYGDGMGVELLTLVGKAFDLNHTYLDNGIYTVEVCVADDDDTGCDVLIVTVNNVVPTVDAGSDSSIIEGETFVGSGSFTDAASVDTWTATVDYGDGSGPQPLTLTGNVFSLNHVYNTAGIYTVTVTVLDDDGGSGSDTVEVIVQTPSEAIEDLVDTVEGFNLHQGIENSLDAKLNAAIQALDDVNQNNDVGAINALQAFINAVEAQRGNKITNAQADELIAAAQRIIDSLLG